MTRRFEGKVALITGGGSGMGRATALRFASEGASVVVADISEPGGQETVDRIHAAGGVGQFVATDVTQASEVSMLIEHTIASYGRIDCAFNNAGITNPVTAPLHELTEENFDREIAINLKGVFLCLKYEIPHMLEAGGGAIVNTASVLGLIGAPGKADYVASKHGVYGLNKSAALDYAKHGIRINAVCPGAIDTPMLAYTSGKNPQVQEQLQQTLPMGRIGRPEEIAETVLWLCSDAASYVTGQAISVDGGLFPR